VGADYASQFDSVGDVYHQVLADSRVLDLVLGRRSAPAELLRAEVRGSRNLAALEETGASDHERRAPAVDHPPRVTYARLWPS